MLRQVALLRGINVGGHRKLPMADLRALMADLGYGNVRTYIQSGNVIFDGNDDPDATARRIGSHIESTFEIDVAVMVRTIDDLVAAARSSPYASAGLEIEYIAVAFCDRVVDPAIAAAADASTHAPDVFTIDGREIHLYCPSGFGRTKLTHGYLEKTLGIASTIRNWKTVTKLVELGSVDP